MLYDGNALTFVCFHSRQAIQKYIKANNSLGNPTDTMFKSRVNGAIRKGLESGDFSFPKGTPTSCWLCPSCLRQYTPA